PDGYIPDECLSLTTTPGRTPSPSPTGTGAVTTTATTPTATPVTPTTSFATATTQIGPPPLSPTVRPPTLIPTPEVTPIPSNALPCTPGEPVLITGNGPPRAAFLLYFGQRAVGGGSIEPSGRFAIPLVVGRERAGPYTVTVRVRGTTQ